VGIVPSCKLIQRDWLAWVQAGSAAALKLRAGLPAADKQGSLACFTTDSASNEAINIAGGKTQVGWSMIAGTACQQGIVINQSRANLEFRGNFKLRAHLLVGYVLHH
jgi:hypothetical protein